MEPTRIPAPMVRRLPLLMLPALLVIASASAQDEKPFALRTAHAPTAQLALDLFGVQSPLPALKPGENWLLQVGPRGRLRAVTDTSLITALQIAIRPVPLMESHPRAWAAAVRRVREFVGRAWNETGIESVQLLGLFDVLVDFPTQVEHVRLRVDGDLSRPLDGVEVQVWLRAVPGSWLETFIKTVQPLGLPTIYGVAPQSAVTLRVAVNLDGAEAGLAPLADLFAKMGATSTEQAERAASVYWQAFDGSMLASWDPEAGDLISIVGLRDPAVIRDLYDHPAFHDWMKATRTTPTGFAVEFTPDALTHGGASLWKSVVRPPEGVPSTVPEGFLAGDMVSYGGVAGNYLLGTTGIDESGVAELIDTANKQAFHRNILPTMMLALLQIDSAKLLSAHSDKLDLARMPASVAVNLGTTGELLFLSLRLR